MSTDPAQRLIERLFADLARCINGLVCDATGGSSAEDLAHAAREVTEACAKLGKEITSAIDDVSLEGVRRR